MYEQMAKVYDIILEILTFIKLLISIVVIKTTTFITVTT